MGLIPNLLLGALLLMVGGLCRADVILYPNDTVIYVFDWGAADISNDTAMNYYFDLKPLGSRRQVSWEGRFRLYDEIELHPGLDLTGRYGAGWNLRIPRLFPQAEVLFTDPVSYIAFTYIDTIPGTAGPVEFSMRAIGDQQFGSIAGRLYAGVPGPPTLFLMGSALLGWRLLKKSPRPIASKRAFGLEPLRRI